MDDTTAPDVGAGTSRARAYYELTKPGITGYVMITAGVSAFVGSRGLIELPSAIHTMAGTGLATGGALALNQFVEREADGIKTRTRGRPLPTDRLTAVQAVSFGSALLLVGVTYLGVALGALPALLAAASAFVYHAVYTPLKSRSYAATLTGAVPGALPMLIGWSAATGTIDLGGLALFTIGYLWQLPHVLGLAWMLKDDYALVGFKLIPGGGARSIGIQMVVATGVLLPVSWSPTLIGLAGVPYLVAATLLGIGFLAVAIAAARNLTQVTARRVFFASLIYQPLLLGFMLFDTIRL
jgi:protoheme IX farnesyltransferase